METLSVPYVFLFALAMAFPVALAFLLIAGYWGVIPLSLFPATPADMAIFLGAAPLTAATGFDGL
jgi:hypothetical protein